MTRATKDAERKAILAAAAAGINNTPCRAYVAGDQVVIVETPLGDTYELFITRKKHGS